jgi:hypothetical protein
LASPSINRHLIRDSAFLNPFLAMLLFQVGQLVFLVFMESINFALLIGWLFSFSAIAVMALVGSVSTVFNLRSPNLVGIFGLSFAMFVLLPLPSVVRDGIGTQGGDPIIFCAATVIAFFVTIFVSFVATHALNGFRIQNSHANRQSNVENLILLLFVACSLSILWFVLTVKSDLPIFLKVSGHATQEVMVARSAALTGRSGSLLAYLFEFSRNFALPIVSAYSVVSFKRSRSFEAGVIAAVFLSVATVASVLTLEKSPLVRLMVVCLVAWAWEGRSISRRVVLVGTLSVFVTFLVLVRVGIGNGGTSNELGRVLTAAWQRVADGPTRIAGDYFAWHDESRSAFGLGRSTSPLSRMLTDSSVDPAALVYAYADPTGTLKGSANGAFFAQLWVDFGWFGILVGSTIVGAGISTIQFVIQRIKNSIIRSALFGLFAVQTAFLILTAASESIFSIGFGALDLILLAVAWQRMPTNCQSEQKFS